MILLVDDEKDITKLVQEALQQEGITDILIAHNGTDAIGICKERKPDLVVLDIMLPDLDGIEVCRQLRTFTYCPILFLSAKSSDMDKIIGLGCGGDDYITKPFSVKELVYRVKAQLRRQRYQQEAGAAYTEEPKQLQVADLILNPETGNVTKAGSLIDLTAREFKMLQYFMEHKNMILSKERIYEAVWGELSAVCDNTIMVHVRHLREKLEKDPSVPEILLTVKGLGYKLVDEETAKK